MSQPSRRKRSSNDPKNDPTASKDPDVKDNEPEKWLNLELAAIHSFLSRGAPGPAISLLLQIKCETSYRRGTRAIGNKKRVCDCYNSKTKQWDLPKTDAHIKRLVGQQGLDDLLTPLQLTFEQGTELSVSHEAYYQQIIEAKNGPQALGLPESKAKRTGLARFPTGTNWGLSAEHRVNRQEVDLSAALNDFDDSPRASSEEFDASTALNDFDDPPHNRPVEPWEARTNARVNAVFRQPPPPIQPPPQSPYVRSPGRHSTVDMTGVTNTMGPAAIAAPVRSTIEKGNKASSARALEDISKVWSPKAPFAGFGTAERDHPPHSPIASARGSRAPAPEQEAQQSRIPRFDGIDKPTSDLWTRKEDWDLATMYAENREWPEINHEFRRIGPGAAKTRWRTLSIDPEYAWAEPERQRRVDEEKMAAKMMKKRKADEKNEKQAHAEKGDKPSSSGGHKRGKH